MFARLMAVMIVLAAGGAEAQKSQWCPESGMLEISRPDTLTGYFEKLSKACKPGDTIVIGVNETAMVGSFCDLSKAVSTTKLVYCVMVRPRPWRGNPDRK